ncbi:hypothetical protein GUJ93_ZPchr0003g17608 [Zizania palustris]|uniref:Uncharacterized protein n=1 Tax=Zizania palustris TaxID=103762 RepID=A0A8J5SWA3_ZIZPA|nr:hypothetical protein GUJ93_ZPchr0003g17608 [Zizania palustris]
MFCGTGSFKRMDVDPEARSTGDGAGESPKQQRRKHCVGRKANPYAERGLEKFSTVLSELQTRRNRILRRVVGSDSGLVMVRFVQSNGAWEPIVLKLPDEHRIKAAAAKKFKLSTTQRPDSASPREAAAENAAGSGASKAPARMRRAALYWPVAMVLIVMLACLAVFGSRVFAICCTSICWYLVPTLSSSCRIGAGQDAPQAVAAGLRRSMEKRKVSPPPVVHAKKVSSCGVHEVGSSPRSHVKRKLLPSLR